MPERKQHVTIRLEDAPDDLRERADALVTAFVLIVKGHHLVDVPNFGVAENCVEVILRGRVNVGSDLHGTVNVEVEPL